MKYLKWGYNKLTEEQENQIWSRFQDRKSVKDFIGNLELFFNQMLILNGKVRPKGQMELELLIIARTEMETIINKISENNQLSLFTEIEIQKINRFLEMSNLGARGKLLAAGMYPKEIPFGRSMLGYENKSLEEKKIQELIEHGQSLGISSMERFKKILENKDRQIIRYQQEREKFFYEIDYLRERVHILEQMLAEKENNNNSQTEK